MLVKWFGPDFAAYLSYLGINWGKEKPGLAVLCLYRESFIKDIMELRKRTRFNYPIVMGGFTRFQMAWFPPKMQMQTFYQAYEGPGKSEAIEKSTQYARQLIRLANRRQRIGGILSANFDYWQDLGFKLACKEMSIPFIVLSREHPIVSKACAEVTNWYKRAGYRFDGTVIAVAGKSTYDVLEKVGSVCKTEQVVITGLPRFDAWLDVNTSKPLQNRLYITLLTFTEGYYADETFKHVLSTFCEAARQFGGGSVRFLVKTKDIHDTLVVRRLIRDLDGLNMECSHQADLFRVLPESRLVINYNSLSLVEAAMARASIVIPAWEECKDRGNEVMYSIENPKVAKLVQFVHSAPELLERIGQSVNGVAKSFERHEVEDFVNEFIHIPAQSSCSKEFESLLTKYI